MIRSIEIQNKSIIDVEAECIVDSISHDMHSGGGISSTIFSAAGPGLREECDKIGNCNVGCAVVTDSYNLKKKNIKYIIHTATPVWQKHSHATFQPLELCYLNSLKMAKKMSCHSVAIPLLGVGNHGCPKRIGLMIACRAIVQFLDILRYKYPEYPINIILAIYDTTLLDDAQEEFVKHASSYMKDVREGMTFEEYSLLVQSLISMVDFNNHKTKDAIKHILYEVYALNKDNNRETREFKSMGKAIEKMDVLLSPEGFARFSKYPENKEVSQKRLLDLQQFIM